MKWQKKLQVVFAVLFTFLLFVPQTALAQEKVFLPTVLFNASPAGISFADCKFKLGDEARLTEFVVPYNRAFDEPLAQLLGTTAAEVGSKSDDFISIFRANFDLFGGPLVSTPGGSKLCYKIVDDVSDLTIWAELGGYNPGAVPVPPEHSEIEFESPELRATFTGDLYQEFNVLAASPNQLPTYFWVYDLGLPQDVMAKLGQVIGRLTRVGLPTSTVLVRANPGTWGNLGILASEVSYKSWQAYWHGENELGILFLSEDGEQVYIPQTQTSYSAPVWVYYTNNSFEFWNHTNLSVGIDWVGDYFLNGLPDQEDASGFVITNRPIDVPNVPELFKYSQPVETKLGTVMSGFTTYPERAREVAPPLDVNDEYADDLDIFLEQISQMADQVLPQPSPDVQPTDDKLAPPIVPGSPEDYEGSRCKSPVNGPANVMLAKASNIPYYQLRLGTERSNYSSNELIVLRAAIDQIEIFLDETRFNLENEVRQESEVYYENAPEYTSDGTLVGWKQGEYAMIRDSFKFQILLTCHQAPFDQAPAWKLVHDLMHTVRGLVYEEPVALVMDQTWGFQANFWPTWGADPRYVQNVPVPNYEGAGETAWTAVDRFQWALRGGEYKVITYLDGVGDDDED